MKRGLKVAFIWDKQITVIVATYAPMKRGLKVKGCTIGSLETELGSNLCPDEKGTERSIPVYPFPINICSNLCPDEKGTESQLLSYIQVIAP